MGCPVNLRAEGKHTLSGALPSHLRLVTTPVLFGGRPDHDCPERTFVTITQVIGTGSEVTAGSVLFERNQGFLSAPNSP
jgi:hypothetical protein